MCIDRRVQHIIWKTYIYPISRSWIFKPLYHVVIMIYYDPLLSNLINKTSILDFFIITRLSLLLLIRLNDNPLVSKKYIGLTTCFNFMLMTSEWRRRGSFLYWSHTPCSYSFSRVSFAYIRKTNRKWGNQFYLTHACM